MSNRKFLQWLISPQMRCSVRTHCCCLLIGCENKMATNVANWTLLRRCLLPNSQGKTDKEILADFLWLFSSISRGPDTLADLCRYKLLLIYTTFMFTRDTPKVGHFNYLYSIHKLGSWPQIKTTVSMYWKWSQKEVWATATYTERTIISL